MTCARDWKWCLSKFPTMSGGLGAARSPAHLHCCALHNTPSHEGGTPLALGMTVTLSAAYTGTNWFQTQVDLMRPLFAIVPLVALLFWLGEPQDQGAAFMADGNTTRPSGTDHLSQAFGESRPLSTSVLTPRSTAHTGMSAHLVTTGWQPNR